eukprot:g5592.t1
MALASALLSALAMRWLRLPPSPTPWRTYFPVALSNTAASPFGYHSLRYISFPLLTLAKASKLLPIMLMGVLLGSRRYSRREYAAAACISVGIVAFSSKPAPAANGGKSQALGLALVAVNLALDGFTNARQEHIYRTTRCRNYHMMLGLNVWSAVLLGAWLLLSSVAWGAESELARAAAFAAHSPEIIAHVALFSLCGAVGQMFIFTAIEEFGAVTCTTICLTRKFFSILLSIVLYKHVMRPAQWAGIFIVFAGLGLQALGKAQSKQQQPQQNGKKKK